MASFMNRLESEIARRDAAIGRVKQNMAEITTHVSDKYSETKTALAPKNIVENLKSEYGPDKLITAHPWPSMLVAMAAGFLIVPLFKRAASAVQSQPAPPPQRVVIELKGAGPVAPMGAAQGHSLGRKASLKDIISDGVALIGSMGTMLSHFNMGSRDPHHDGNGRM
jgi:hypothetical protein